MQEELESLCATQQITETVILRTVTTIQNMSQTVELPEIQPLAAESKCSSPVGTLSFEKFLELKLKIYSQIKDLKVTVSVKVARLKKIPSDLSECNPDDTFVNKEHVKDQTGESNNEVVMVLYRVIVINWEKMMD